MAFLTEAEAVERAASFKYPLILYHKDCLDGWAAAFLALKLYGEECKHIAISPGADPLSDEVLAAASGKDVLMLDVSRPPAEIDKLLTFADSLLILDHHKSNEEDARSWGGEPVAFFDQERSGAGLALDVFFPGARYPRRMSSMPISWDLVEIILAIEDRDLWRFKLPNTKAICASMHLYEKTYEEWDIYTDNAEDREEEGESLLRFQESEVERIAKGAFLYNILEGAILVCNTPIHQSEVGELLCTTRAPAPLSTVLLWYLDSDGAFRGSFRSAPNGADVSKIAKRFGGGGHAHAAGFKLTGSFHWIPLFS